MLPFLSIYNPQLRWRSTALTMSYSGREISKLRPTPFSYHVLPLSTVKEKFISAWESLTWPTIKSILKANLSVTFALCVMFYHPFLETASVATALTPVAVEFVLPCQSSSCIAEVENFKKKTIWEFLQNRPTHTLLSLSHSFWVPGCCFGRFHVYYLCGLLYSRHVLCFIGAGCQ